MKVKIITNLMTRDDFQKEINEFIKDKEVISIKFQGYVGYSPRAYIVYEDDKEKLYPTHNPSI